MLRFSSLVLALGLSAAGIAAASAQAGYGRPLHIEGQGYVGTPVDALPTPFSHGGTCVKQCDFDYAPCDPDYWKVADRRCNFNQKF